MGNMKKVIMAAAVASMGLSAVAHAQSSKFSAATSDHVLLSGTASDFETVLSTGIKTPSQKDLFVQASFECGVFTQTYVLSSLLEPFTSSAEAIVRARVVLDPGTANERLAFPGEITLCSREQTMTAEFAGQCDDANDDGTITADECEDESVDLAIKTLAANAFNFVLTDLESGEHVIAVQAQIETATSDDAAGAVAIVGNGSLGVEEVRMVKSLEVQDDPAGSGDDTWDAFDALIDLGQ
ncbi:MAG: hypothetical protein CMN81_11295 [Spongiibacter sp.]|nr:hypothetical protein [Spongiibacter sp.]MBI58348.1 hypothetical protein [Spongiibacter sp.]MBU72684.1 hypothetical protein [Spongiibacter sp.]